MVAPFWPQCFDGDETTATVGIAMAITDAAVEALGGDALVAAATVAAVVACVNGITEPQLHVRFVVDSLTTTTSKCGHGDGVPPFEVPPAAPGATGLTVKHLIDHCPSKTWSGYGTIGDLCTGASAVTLVHDNMCSTMAHELGHNLGASHPFDDESGHGVVGGIMDYARQHAYGSILQFAPESRPELCAGLSAATACGLTAAARRPAPVSDANHYVCRVNHNDHPVEVTRAVGIAAVIAIMCIVYAAVMCVIEDSYRRVGGLM